VNKALDRNSGEFHLREILSGGSISLVNRIVGLAASYALAVAIGRYAGAEAMGVFALSLTFLNVMSILARLGLDTALLRFLASCSAKAELSKANGIYIETTKIVVVSSGVFSLLGVLLAPRIAVHLFGNPLLSVPFTIASLAVLPMSVGFVNSEGLRAMKRIGAYSFYQYIIVPVSALILFVMGTAYWAAEPFLPVLAWVGGTFLLLGASLLSLRKVYAGVRPSITMQKREMISVSFPMLLSSAMMFIWQWTDLVMLGIFRTTNEVGIYNVVIKVAAITGISLMAVNGIVAPKLAESYAKRDFLGLEKIVRQSTKVIFWSSFPLLIFFVFCPDFVLAMFGEEFGAGASALLFLAAGQFFSAISGSVGYILQMTGKQRLFQNIVLATLLMNIVLNVLLIPGYGIAGVAFASAISRMFLNLISMVYIKRSFGITTLYLPFMRHTLNASS